jgi:DNA invertase Pin-like site-specific DNA recombinase
MNTIPPISHLQSSEERENNLLMVERARPNDPLATTTAQGRLMLIILGGLAELERELILDHTGDGRKHAKARGVRFGRPPAHQRQEAIQRLAEGATQADLARTYGVSQATISRLQPSPFEAASGAAG